MDYKNYRGDFLKIPEWLEPYLHLLKNLGVALALTPSVIGWLSVLRIIPRYSWWYVLAVIGYPLGLTCFIIGLSFSTRID
jgi:hypothetical protein